MSSQTSLSVVVNNGGVLFCIVEFELNDDDGVHELSSPIFSAVLALVLSSLLRV